MNQQKPNLAIGDDLLMGLIDDDML